MNPQPAEATGIAFDAPSKGALEESRRLRRVLRDVVALSTLPAVWSGRERDQIARSLGDVLLNTLSLDLVFLRLRGQKDGQVDILCSRGPYAGYDCAVKASIARLLDADRGESPKTIPDPGGAGTLRVAFVRFGVGLDSGDLVACSRNPDFPTEHERLLLGVGVNQMAMVLQRRQAEEGVRDQREWLRVTLGSIGDAVIATDIEAKVTLLNAGAEELTGWTQDDALGRPLATVFRVFDEGTGHPVANPGDTVLREGRIVYRALLIAKDGTERSIQASAAPIRDAAGVMLGIVAVFRSAMEERRTEQHRNARLALTHVLNQSASVQEAATGVLQAVCEGLAWDAGFFWIAEDDGKRLECRAQWHGPDATLWRFGDASRGQTFESAVGLPGRVWASGKPAWIPNLGKDENFPRLAAAREAGLHCAFACPVIIGGRTLGVIEFYHHGEREPDPDLLEMMVSAAGNFGQFIERKAAEDELRRSEQELADFFENATVGLHWVGPDGKIVRVNRAELEMLGYSREEYLGRHIAEFHADDEVIRDILEKLSAGEKLAEYPARVRCKDGSIKDVLIDSSVLWKDGQFVHTRCFTRDVTGRRQAESALADTRARLDAALDAGSIATWTWDIPNNLLYAGRKLAQLFNLPPSDASGSELDNYLRSIHPEDLNNVTAALERSVASGEPYEADYRIVQADGSIRWVTARGQVEHDACGRPVRMPGVLVDITERKLLEEALRDADRRKDEFLATLAHELRNPLAPIRTSLELLKMPRIDAATLQRTRAMMDRQVHQLVRLVDDLLDVSRVMGGKIELRRERVELAAVIARAVETVQPLIEVQGHQLELTIPNESLVIYADPVRLAQVVANLLTNATKYTEAKGHVWITVRREESGQVALTVRDDGIGIAPDMLPRVFELFMQVDHSSAKAQGGLGIGLTLAKNLVEMHGGTLEARSAGLGKGCEFTVRLALQSWHDDGMIGSPDETHPHELPAAGHRLLIVDDNEDAAESLAELLRLWGHEVRVAHSGAIALAIARTYLPRVVFLDIGMPGMDGLEVARRLRQLPGLEGTVLAALTGWGQREDRRRTQQAGFDHHFVKPPEPKTLEALLNAL